MTLARRPLGILASAIIVSGCAGTPERSFYATTIDIIQCRGGYERECLHFYEENWLIFREAALEREIISGFQLLRSVEDTTGGVGLVLITDYPDSTAYAEAEKNFQPLMRELRPDGPSLLNEAPRSEFVENRLAFDTRPLRRDP